jgi:hypothetical protein
METINDRYKTKLRRPINVGTRFSEDEFALIKAAATSANVPYSDWFRGTVLDALTNQKDDPTLVAVLEEIEFIKLFLLNTLPILLTGKLTTDEQIQGLIRKCSTEKHNAAKQLIESKNRKDKS